MSNGAARADLADSLRRHLALHPLIETGRPVAVAVSGGLDSVVLLHLLRFRLRDRVGAISAAHFDHAMRPCSARDAAWVAGLCMAWEVPLAFDRAASVPTSEAEARRLRYAFLETVTPPGTLILTAHHADDQAETVLFRAARGTGLRGLRGIAPRRGRVVRPLLPFHREALAAYAAAARISWRTDPTNVDLRFARNRIRHRVLPELERARPGAMRGLVALAEEARHAEHAWDHLLEGLEREVVLDRGGQGTTLARDGLLAYHPHVRARLLRRLLRRYGTAPGRAGTQAALEFITSGPSGGSLDLAAGVRLERDFDRVRIAVTGGRPAPDTTVEIHDSTAGTGRAVIGGQIIEIRWGPAATGQATRARLEHPRFPLTVRAWRPGDRIRLGYGTKKLKKLLAERRLDRRARARVPVLVDAAGQVLWVVGHARAQGVTEEGDGFEIAVTDAGPS